MSEQSQNLTHSLYGLSSTNCCNKDDSSEKIVNTLLPISYGIYSQQHNITIPFFEKENITNFEEDITSGIRIDTEKCHIHPQFINPPPNDICVARIDSNVNSFYENKIIMFKNKKTELILRQDCYAFNCVQNILLKNVGKSYLDIISLLNDSTIIESPYLWMLLWKKDQEDIIRFDCVILSDVSVLRMIYNAKTPRSNEAIYLINTSLAGFILNKNMTYKENKTSTVPHQKVSLFPLRDILVLKSYIWRWDVKATDIILNDIRPDTNLWQEISKNRLIEKIHLQDIEIKRLKSLCDEMQ